MKAIIPYCYAFYYPFKKILSCVLDNCHIISFRIFGKILIFLFVLWSTPDLFAQQERNQKSGSLKGEVEDKDLIFIQNLNTGEKTFATIKGAFQIDIGINDVVLVYASHIKVLRLRVGASLLTKDVIEIPIEAKINKLQEVVVTETIERDSITSQSLGIIQHKIPVLTKPQRVLKEAEAGKWGNIAPWKGPFAFNLYKFLNRTLARKRLLKLRQIAAVEKEQMYIDHAYGQIDSLFFAEELKLPFDQWYQFVYYCVQDPEFEKESKNLLTYKYYFTKKKEQFIRLQKD